MTMELNQISLLIYTALIESFGHSGNIEEALRLFGEMKAKADLSINLH